MNDPDVFFSHDEAAIYKLHQELERLRAALKSYADLINKNIIENDGPNRFHLDGVTYEGPEVDAFFRILRGLEKLARTALEGSTV